MRLQLLGPVGLTVGRAPVDVGAPRQRVVLAVLALNLNRVTPVEELVDALWDGSPPSTARGQIHVCISSLRKLFGRAGAPDVIRTRPPGYLLELFPEQLDAEQFARLAALAAEHTDAGRIAEASSTLHEALRLWRGPAMAGVRSDLVRRSAVLLEESRLAMLEKRIALDLELGLHQQIVGELQALCDEHPVREEFHRLLMLALYRCGRQAEALAVGRNVRRFLIEEAGIEPGTEVRHLERSILHQDPALDLPADPSSQAAASVSAPPGPGSSSRPPEPDGTSDTTGTPHPVPHLLPASIADFTGRRTEIGQIERRLTEGQDPYAVRIVAVCGRAGVGKSSLAVRVAHRLDAAFPDGQLYANLAASDGDSSAPRLLTRFLRALGVEESSIPKDFAERVGMYRSRLASKRVLLLLDNVTTEEQILPLLPGSPTCAVIVTCRFRLGGLSGWHRAEVGPFDFDDAIQLLGRIVGEERVWAEWQDAVKLVDLCGGLPLALRIAGARLASRPKWRIGSLVRRLTDETRRLDEFTHQGLALRSTMDSAYASLGRQAQRLVRLCTLMPGLSFPGWTAAALLDADPQEAEKLLESLVDAQMLDHAEHPDTSLPQYLLHDLTRLYAHEQLILNESQEDQRAAVDRVLRGWLALVEQNHRGTHNGNLPGVRVDKPRDGAWGSKGSLVEADTVRWARPERSSLIAAIQLAADAGFADLCWELALASAAIFERGGHLDEWNEITQVALAAAEGAGAADVSGRPS